jgi:hypothetical protein
MAKATQKSKIKLGKHSKIVEVPLFGASGHIDYSGYGAHQKDRRADRRNRKIEERKIQRGDW